MKISYECLSLKLHLDLIKYIRFEIDTCNYFSMKYPLTYVVCTVSHRHSLRTVPDSPRGPEDKTEEIQDGT